MKLLNERVVTADCRQTHHSVKILLISFYFQIKPDDVKDIFRL